MLTKEFKTPSDEGLKKVKRLTEVFVMEPEPQVGQTPKEVVWTKNKAKLYRYQPAVKKTNKVPILMIYALINKPYILDLYPGNSLIEHLTNKGHGTCLKLKHQQLCQLCYDRLGSNDQKTWIGPKEWAVMLRTFGKGCNWMT